MPEGSKTAAQRTGSSKGRPSESAGHYLVTRVPEAQKEDLIGDVLKRFTAESYDTSDIVYIVDKQGLLRGMAQVADLLRLPVNETVGDAMTPVIITVPPDADQEDVAGIAIRHQLAAVPVVNQCGRFLGIVPPRSLIRILRLEHIEDMHRFTGILDGSEQARNAIEAPPFHRAWKRLPWLVVGLMGSIVATFLMSTFERTLKERIVVAFFVPGIVYLADAIGTQTEAIAVRGLSFSNGTLRSLFLGELITGLLIGLVLGSIAFPLIAVWYGDGLLAFAVALSICLAGTFATSIGLLFPWVLSKAGLDPAYGSGPVATIVQDVLSLLVYFILVGLLLP